MKAELEYQQVADVPGSAWFLKRRTTYLMGRVGVTSGDSPAWSESAQTDQFIVSDLTINCEVPASSFELPVAKAGMARVDADTNSASRVKDEHDSGWSWHSIVIWLIAATIIVTVLLLWAGRRWRSSVH